MADLLPEAYLSRKNRKNQKILEIYLNLVHMNKVRGKQMENTITSLQEIERLENETKLLKSLLERVRDQMNLEDWNTISSYINGTIDFNNHEIVFGKGLIEKGLVVPTEKILKENKLQNLISASENMGAGVVLDTIENEIFILQIDLGKY